MSSTTPAKKVYTVPKPTPYPINPNQTATANNVSTVTNQNNSISSQIITFKKELSNGQSQNDSLHKLNQRLEKKSKEQSEEIRYYKQANDSGNGEVIILQKSGQKISNEKALIEGEVSEKKKYISKLETKLVSNASNQYGIELNTRLRNEIESLNIEIKMLINNNDKLTTDSIKQNQEMKILNKAIGIKIEEMNTSKTNGISFTKDGLINGGAHKEEIEKCFEKVFIYEKENKQGREEMQEKDEKIKELEYAKAHMTQLYVVKENIANDWCKEKEGYEQKIKNLANECATLRDGIDKANIQQKAIETDIQFEASNNNQKISDLQNENLKLTTLTNEITIKNEMLEKTLSILKDKYNSLENNYKAKAETLASSETRREALQNQINSYQNLIEKQKFENETGLSNNTTGNTNLHKKEEENIEGLAKIKSVCIERENCQDDLIKQNMQLTQNERKFKQEISNLNVENEKLQKEKEMYRLMVDDGASKTNTIIKEKNEAIADNSNKEMQIKQLQNNNHAGNRDLSNIIEGNNIDLISNISRDIEDKKARTESGLNMNCSSKNMETKVMLSGIREEKEKSKDLMGEIRKLKAAGSG